MQSSNSGNAVGSNGADITTLPNDNDGFDFKYLVAKVAGNWQWFALSLILTVGLGVLYLLYAIPTFTITARVLVNGRNANKTNSGVTETQMLDELGLFSQQSDVNNEIQQIHSRTLLEQTMRDLQTNVSYWAQGDIRFSEVYNKSSFFIELLDLKKNLDDPLAWDIRVNKDDVKFIDDFTGQVFHLTWGDTAKLKYCTFVLKRNNDVPAETDPNRPLGLKIAPFDATYYTYDENLLAFLTAENTTSIDVTLDANVPAKGEDFVNHLLTLYVQRKINTSNALADSTITFIDERISGVARELSNVESGIEGLKKSSGITDLQEQGKALISQNYDAFRALDAQDAQIQWVESLEAQLAGETRTLPTTSPITDQAYIALVEKYNNLLQQRQTALLNSTENNPAIKGIDAQLAQIRNNLSRTLKTYKDGLVVQKNNLAKQSSNVQSAIQSLPTKQKQYLEASRRQDVLQQLYVYLLTVREQTAVTKSNNIAPISVIDPARAGVYPSWPNKAIVIILCIFLAIVIPSVVILINELINNKVTTPGDITNSTAAPLIAQISQSKSKSPVIVTKESRTAVSEQFRTLRTNLLFRLAGTENKVIMCTSTVSGEGKSFVTLNLAVAMALSGKKVLLLDMELRKSQLAETLGIESNVGIADYLEKGASLNEVIIPSGVNENLWILSAGELEANPSEALLNDRMKPLFEDIRRKFDYIFIDTPPAALVTDAQVIGMYADLTLYIVRQQYTYKKHVDVIEDLRRNKKLKNIYVIMNDVKLVAGYNKGYGIGYRFDEDYGYYQQEDTGEKRSLLNRIFPDADAVS